MRRAWVTRLRRGFFGAPVLCRGDRLQTMQRPVEQTEFVGIDAADPPTERTTSRSSRPLLVT
jgi:hypothetical protein